MSRGPCNIRQHDIDVIYKAAKKAGYGSVRVEVDLDRKTITATASDAGQFDASSATPLDEWRAKRRGEG